MPPHPFETGLWGWGQYGFTPIGCFDKPSPGWAHVSMPELLLFPPRRIVPPVACSTWWGWAPRTRKRHQQEHRPQRPTERSNPTQHAKGRTGDCPGPRKETTTRRNVTRGVAHDVLATDTVTTSRRRWQCVAKKTSQYRESERQMPRVPTNAKPAESSSCVPCLTASATPGSPNSFIAAPAALHPGAGCTGTLSNTVGFAPTDADVEGTIVSDRNKKQQSTNFSFHCEKHRCV